MMRAYFKFFVAALISLLSFSLGIQFSGHHCVCTGRSALASDSPAITAAANNAAIDDLAPEPFTAMATVALPDAALVAPLHGVVTVFNYMRAVQYGFPSCTSRLRRVGPPRHGMGFAASLQLLSHEFMNVAGDPTQPTAALSLAGWAYGCGERGSDWECFEPLSPCSETQISAAPEAFGGEPPPACHGIPLAVRGPRWWALVQAYVFTPAARQQERIACRRRELGIPTLYTDTARARDIYEARVGQLGAYGAACSDAAVAEPAPPPLAPGCLSAGIHIRLGDRMAHDVRLHGMDEYISAVAALVRKGLQLCLVIVATDDDNVLRDVRGALALVLPQKARVVIFPPRVPRPDTSATVMAAWLSEQPGLLRKNATEDIVDIIDTLSETSVFIGICMSQVARTIAALQYVKGTARHAPIGVDTAECLSFVGHSPPIEEGWLGLTQL